MASKGEDKNQAKTGSSKFFQGQSILYKVLDVEAVPVNNKTTGAAAGEPDQAVKTFTLNSQPQIIKSDIAIAGGGMGGVAAALAIGDSVKTVLLEETSWLGGQLSTQGVSALDENKYIETTGGCLNYLQMRSAIREAYRKTNNLTEAAQKDPILNLGNCWVTRLAFEPAVAIDTLNTMLKAQIDNGNLTVLKRTKVVAVRLADENSQANQSGSAAKIEALLAVNLDSGIFIEVQTTVTIDATELGDLMPLAKIPYQTGSDSLWVTGEKHAPETGNPDNVQDFTYPFIVTYHPGENHTIDKPSDYDTFNDAGKFTFDGYKMFAETDDIKDGKKRHLLPFWTYRRLIDKELFKGGIYGSDISMINWDSNDLRGKNIIDKSPEIQCDYLSLAKRLSLGFLYWLQTAAPKDDGGFGYKELKLDCSLLGTTDGLSKYPYIREARRLVAASTIAEQDIVEAKNPGARSRLWSDSCAIGLYPVDIHGYQEIPGAAQQTKPFQVPLGALVTEYCGNYIAACKNIGVTHITNGAYRLHPIEWAIGTAAGVLARFSIAAQKSALSCALAPNDLLSVQIELVRLGAPIYWFDDLPATAPAFVGAQILATTGLIECDQTSLSFNPDQKITLKDLATAKEKAGEIFYGLVDLSKELTIIEKDMDEMTRSLFAQRLFAALENALQKQEGALAS